MSGWRLAGGALTAAAALVASSAQPAAAQEATQRVIRLHKGAYLGVSLADVGSDEVSRLRLPGERGALVKEVSADSPAAKAGLKEDDVILSYDGETVHSAAQLSRLVRETPAGRKVALGISRNGSRQELAVTLEEGRRMGELMDGMGNFDLRLPELPALPEISEDVRRGVMREVWRGRPRLGIHYQELSDQLARFFKVEGGLLVTSVVEGSAAEKAGLRAGDVIVRADGRAVRDAGDLQDRVRPTDSAQELVLGVQREGREVEVRVQLEPRERRERRRPSQPTT